MRDHRAALAHLAFVERRRVYRHEHLGAEFDQLVGWIVCVKSFTPESLVVPKILADRDAEFRFGKWEKVAFGARLEVAWIVEDVVFRQERLICKAKQLLVANDGGGVEETPAGCQARRTHRTNDRRDSFCRFYDLFKWRECAALHFFIEEPI